MGHGAPGGDSRKLNKTKTLAVVRLVLTENSITRELEKVAAHIPDDLAVVQGEGSDLGRVGSRAATGSRTIGADTGLCVARGREGGVIRGGIVMAGIYIT